MHIAIAGNIGSGKTTLTTKLAKHYKSIDALMVATTLDLIAVDEIGERIAESVVEFFSSAENIRIENEKYVFDITFF